MIKIIIWMVILYLVFNTIIKKVVGFFKVQDKEHPDIKGGDEKTDNVINQDDIIDVNYKEVEKEDSDNN